MHFTLPQSVKLQGAGSALWVVVMVGESQNLTSLPHSDCRTDITTEMPRAFAMEEMEQTINM